jgi:hypothetical protein
MEGYTSLWGPSLEAPLQRTSAEFPRIDILGLEKLRLLGVQREVVVNKLLQLVTLAEQRGAALIAGQHPERRLSGQCCW